MGSTKIMRFVKTGDGVSEGVALSREAWNTLMETRKYVVNTIYREIYFTNLEFLEPDDCYELARQWANQPEIFYKYIKTYEETEDMYEAMRYLHNTILEHTCSSFREE